MVNFFAKCFTYLILKRLLNFLLKLIINFPELKMDQNMLLTLNEYQQIPVNVISVSVANAVEQDEPNMSPDLSLISSYKDSTDFSCYTNPLDMYYPSNEFQNYKFGSSFIENQNNEDIQQIMFNPENLIDFPPEIQLSSKQIEKSCRVSIY